MLNRLSPRIRRLIGGNPDDRDESDGDRDQSTTEPAPNPGIWESVLDSGDSTRAGSAVTSPGPGEDNDTRHTTDQMTESEPSETEEISRDDDGGTEDGHDDVGETTSTDGDTRETPDADTVDGPTNDSPDEVDVVPSEEKADEPGDCDPAVGNDAGTSAAEPGDSAVEQGEGSTDKTSARANEGEAEAEPGRPGPEGDDRVESPIPAIGVTEPIERDEYVDRLEEKVRELQGTVETLETTVDERESTIESLSTVTPGLDGMHDEPMEVDLYIETLEDHVETLDSELDRKKTVVQELKDEQEDLREEVREETTRDLLSEFLQKVREPLVRGTEQLDDVPDGVKTTIIQFDDLLREYDGEVVDPTPGEEIDRDVHTVRGKEPGEFADGTVKRVDERGLRVDGEVVKQPAVIMTEGTPDKGHGETDDQPTEGSTDERDDDRPTEGSTDEGDDDRPTERTLGQHGVGDQQDGESEPARTVDPDQDGNGSDSEDDDGARMDDADDPPTG